MSVIIERFLNCDGNCGETYGVDTRCLTGAKHREDAKEWGWHYSKGKDYCPKCWAERLKEKVW